MYKRVRVALLLDEAVVKRERLNDGGVLLASFLEFLERDCVCEKMRCIRVSRTERW